MLKKSTTYLGTIPERMPKPVSEPLPPAKQRYWFSGGHYGRPFIQIKDDGVHLSSHDPSFWDSEEKVKEAIRLLKDKYPDTLYDYWYSLEGE